MGFIYFVFQNRYKFLEFKIIEQPKLFCREKGKEKEKKSTQVESLILW